MSDGPAVADATTIDSTEPTPEELMGYVQELSERLAEVSDANAREIGEQLVGAVVDLYGDGLERIVHALESAGDAAAPVRHQLINDEVVSSLLLIHGLYPVPLDERIGGALDAVRPYLESHGGGVELVTLTDGVAKLRLQGACEGCPASAATLELAIRQALEEAAPDLAGLEVEGLVASSSNGAAQSEGGAWVGLDGVEALGEGELSASRTAGVELIVARVSGSLLAYRNACASCGSTLEGGRLESDGTLGCPSCASLYSLPSAGRALAQGGAGLDPVPLLAETSGVRVALSA